MKLFFTMLFALFFFSVQAQLITDFEAVPIETDSFLNGSEGGGDFDLGNIILPNNYNADFSFWSGWALSNKVDTITQGPTNQYSSIAGSGNNDSKNFAVSFAGGAGSVLKTNFDIVGITEIYVTNNAYAYWSMREGDMFAKKFGGVDGNDPDYFLLTMKGFVGDTLMEDSVDFYLADFRFEDNAQDYIVDTWEAIDLGLFEEVDSLLFTLSSSDEGLYGMNTPAYFCVDDVTVSSIILPTSQPQIKLFEVFPNPTTNYIMVNRREAKPYQLRLFDLTGREILHRTINSDHQRIELGDLLSGSYILEVSDGERKQSKVIIKK